MNDSKSKEKCFNYGVNCHWKRNCPNSLAQKNDRYITESLIIEVNFIVGISNSWYVNCGAINHFYNTLHELQKIKKLSDGEITFSPGLGIRVSEVSVKEV